MTLNNVTIDSRDGAGDSATWDVMFGNTSAHNTFINSTFIGEGIYNPGGYGMIVDNCQFIGCGEVAGSAQQIFVKNGRDVSVTRSSDRSLVNNISSPGGNIDFDAASRLLVVQSSDGYVYAGNNKTTDLYEFPNGDENGGEQILYEGNGAVAFQGSVNTTGGPVVVTGFGAASVSMSGGNVSILGWTVLITAGPGMGESRTIVAVNSTSATLDLPWTVQPTSQSDCIITLACTDVTAYQNTLSGDGALSLLANSSGVQFDGLNIAIDGNDISNLPSGVQLSSASAVGSFNLIARNSLHNVAVGLETSGYFSDSPAVSWVVGNVFRDNIITGPAAAANLQSIRQSVGILISGANDDDPAQILMNVFDQNIISDFQTGIQMIYNSNNSYGVGFAGIVDTVLANDFFSSDGSATSTGIEKNWYLGINEDSHLYTLFGNTLFQSFVSFSN